MDRKELKIKRRFKAGDRVVFRLGERERRSMKLTRGQEEVVIIILGVTIFIVAVVIGSVVKWIV